MATKTFVDSYGNNVTQTLDSSGNVIGSRYSASEANMAAAQAKSIASLTPEQRSTALASLAKAGISEEQALSNAPYTKEQMITAGSKGGEYVEPIKPTYSTNWIDPATGNATPPGVGIPSTPVSKTTPPAGATYIDDPAKLKNYTEDQIWRSPDGKIFALQQATLYNPNTGARKAVVAGSTEASRLLSSGWTLSQGADNGDTITSNTMANNPEINIGTGITGSNGSLADQTIGSIGVDVKNTDDLIEYYKNLQSEVKESDLSKQVKDLLSETSAMADTLTGRGAAQIEAEKARAIEQQQQALADKNTELKKKLAEIDALTASYNLENQKAEGVPMTLSRLQGKQAQNYKMYIAQKNLLTSEASYLQADLLGMQGKLEASQAAADRAVELEYMDRESAYNANINQLNILLPQLEKEEAKYASAVSMALQAEKDALAERKSLMTQAVNAGITDSGVLSQVRNATDYFEALQIIASNVPATQSGGSGSAGYGYNTIPTQQEDNTKISFEEFIQQKEQQLGMSLNNPEQYRDEYNQMINDLNMTPVNNGDLSGYSYQVQQVLKGNMPVSSLLSGGTASERNQYAMELADAEQKGILTTSKEERLYSGLDSQTATAVKARVNAFKTEQVVLNYNVINEGWNTVNSIPSDTNNPADDQLFLYSFAKIMDPNSVVREGEYATVAKYAQSWADSFGFKAKRIFSNEKFLTTESINNMKKTLKSKFNSSEANYQNVYNQYVSGINSITGRNDGEKFILDYSTAFKNSVLPNNSDPLGLGI